LDLRRRHPRGRAFCSLECEGVCSGFAVPGTIARTSYPPFDGSFIIYLFFPFPFFLLFTRNYTAAVSCGFNLVFFGWAICYLPPLESLFPRHFVPLWLFAPPSLISLSPSQVFPPAFFHRGFLCLLQCFQLCRHDAAPFRVITTFSALAFFDNPIPSHLIDRLGSFWWLLGPPLSFIFKALFCGLGSSVLVVQHTMFLTRFSLFLLVQVAYVPAVGFGGNAPGLFYGDCSAFLVRWDHSSCSDPLHCRLRAQIFRCFFTRCFFRFPPLPFFAAKLPTPSPGYPRLVRHQDGPPPSFLHLTITVDLQSRDLIMPHLFSSARRFFPPFIFPPSSRTWVNCRSA